MNLPVKTLLKLFLFLVPCISFGQNWELFNSYYRYNYKQDSAPLINSVCFADSFRMSGSDTIYFVNRIVERNNLNNYAQSDTAQLNRWQFLQRSIRRQSNGWYKLFNPGSLVINSLAATGDSWVYDTARNITAVVSTMDTMTLFGTLDSVKYILLNSLDTIVLSHSYGIIRFPADTSDHLQTYSDAFKLSGIQTRNIGARVLTFSDIYNFNVGDVFAYNILYVGSFNTNGIWKYRILSKQVFADSVKYGIYAISWSQTQDPNNDQAVVSEGPGSLTFIDTAMDISNAYPGQFTNFVDLYDGDYSPAIGEEEPFEPYYSFASYIMDNTYAVPCKKLGVNRSFGIYDSIQGTEMISNMSNGGWLFPPYYCVVCEGLGHVHWESQAFEFFYASVELTGYIKNGVTYGTVPADGDLTGVISLAQQSPSFYIYPTIVQDVILVRSNIIPDNNNYHLSVFDLTGRQLLFQELTRANTFVNCSNLASAMYLWRVTDNQGSVLGVGKIIKN